MMRAMNEDTATAPVIVSHIPMIMRRRIRWGDCDPAGIVYTPRFTHFCVEAMETWFGEITGTSWYHLGRDMGLGTPLVHSEIAYKHPLWPGDVLDVTILPERLSRATFGLKFEGRNGGGELCFTGHFVAAFIKKATMKATGIPADFRTRMEAYAQAVATLSAEKPS